MYLTPVVDDLYLPQRRSLAIKESIIRKYEELQKVLEEDLRLTLAFLDVQERAAVYALDGLMESNCSLIQEIEQDLARTTAQMAQKDMPTEEMVTTFLCSSTIQEYIHTCILQFRPDFCPDCLLSVLPSTAGNRDREKVRCSSQSHGSSSILQNWPSFFTLFVDIHLPQDQPPSQQHRPQQR